MKTAHFPAKLWSLPPPTTAQMDQPIIYRASQAGETPLTKRRRHAKILCRPRETATFDDAAEGMQEWKPVHLGWNSI